MNLLLCSPWEHTPYVIWMCSCKFVLSCVSLTLGETHHPSCFKLFSGYLHIPGICSLQVVELAALCWVCWKLRSRACFGNKLIKTPAEFICYAWSFLKQCPGLQNEADKMMLQEGASRLQDMAVRKNHRAVVSRTWWSKIREKPRGMKMWMKLMMSPEVLSVVVFFTVALCSCTFDTFYVGFDINCLYTVVTVKQYRANPQNLIIYFAFCISELDMLLYY